MAPGKRVWIAEQMKGNCRGKGWKDPSFHRKLKGYCLQEIEYRSFERWEPEPQFEAIRPHEKAELCFAFNDGLLRCTSWVHLARWGKAQLWHHLCNHGLFLPLWAGKSEGQALENMIKAFPPTPWHHFQLILLFVSSLFHLSMYHLVQVLMSSADIGVFFQTGWLCWLYLPSCYCHLMKSAVKATCRLCKAVLFPRKAFSQWQSFDVKHCCFCE